MGGWERGDGMYKRYGVVYYIINGLSSDTPFGGLGGRVASMYGAGEYVEMTIKFVVEPCSSGTKTGSPGVDLRMDTQSKLQHFFVPPHTKGISKRSVPDSCTPFLCLCVSPSRQNFFVHSASTGKGLH
jgi:hypothetical protein